MSSTVDCDLLIRETLVSGNYRDPDRTRQDVLEVMSQYPGLMPIADNYVYNDGTEQLLLKLTGTLPIHYKGSVYNIPIDMWLLNTYPYNAPMVFVSPTPGMMIKASVNVTHDGKVKLPYLQEWKHNSSELLLLIQVLIITFQDEPPVYSMHYSTSQTHSFLSFNPPHYFDQDLTPTYPTVGISSERLDLLRSATEPLLRKLYAIYNSTCLETLNADRLRAGGEKLLLMMEKLEAEKADLEQLIQYRQEEITDLEAKIIAYESEIETREINIEDSIVAPRPLFRQIVETNAEEAAIQDAIYYVNECLRVGKMELDQFEKTIRKLARKQFMLRLLLSECRQKAGL